jgi:hypothetical protein
VRHPAPLLITVALVAAACSGSSSDADTTTPPPATTAPATSAPATTAPAEGQDAPVSTTPPATSAPAAEPPLVSSPTVEAAPNMPMVAVVSMVVRDPVQLEATATSGDHTVEVPRTTASESGERTLPIVGLRAGRTYDITVRAVAGGESVDAEIDLEFEVPPLPDWIPNHTVEIADADRMSPGYTLIETRPVLDSEEGDKYMMLVYDEAGEVVWYLARLGGVGGVEQTPDGTLLTHYWPFGIREFDMTGNVLADWRPQVERAEGPEAPDIFPPREDDDPPITDVTADWVELQTFHHENWPMPNGNILGLSTTVHELTPEQRQAICPGDPHEFDAISDVVAEFTRDGTVLRTWDLWDAIDIDEFPGSDMCADPGLFASVVARDWTHANSVVYDDERKAVIISSRHTDQVVAFDYLDAEGPQTDVRWILGAGATMPIDGDLTYHQHAAEVLDDGAIIIYDNGNARPGTGQDPPGNPPYSRAVIYDVDDSSDDRAEWTTTQRWEHVVDGDDGLPIFTAFIGDADALANGNVLITHGGIGPFPPDDESPQHALIIEVVPEGDEGGPVVFSITTDRSERYTVYRSERIESFYVGDAWES